MSWRRLLARFFDVEDTVTPILEVLGSSEKPQSMPLSDIIEQAPLKSGVVSFSIKELVKAGWVMEVWLETPGFTEGNLHMHYIITDAGLKELEKRRANKRFWDE